MTKVFSEDGAHLYAVQVVIPQPVRWVRRIVFVLDAPCLSSDGDTTMLSAVSTSLRSGAEPSFRW